MLELFPQAKSDVTAYSVPAGTETIAPYAIEMNDVITSITLPSSLESCYSGVSDLSKLTTLTVQDGITEISGFSNCPVLTDVTLPDSVMSYGREAFAYCESLTHLDHPSDIREFGALAFFATGFTNVTIPASVLLIDEGVYGCCDKLTSITV